jgi:hypothetical protein
MDERTQVQGSLGSSKMACYFDDRLAAISNEMTEEKTIRTRWSTFFHRAGLLSQWKTVCGVQKQKRSTIMPQKPYSEHHYMELHNATDGGTAKFRKSFLKPSRIY